MFHIKKILLLIVLLTSSVSAEEYTYRGEWKTTNRKLDGSMTCEVTPLGNDQWKGRFHGIWQGVPFDYTVEFKGPAKALEGTAVIDGANYTWKASINQSQFKANFTGDRYKGNFDLKRVNPPQKTKSTVPELYFWGFYVDEYDTAQGKQYRVWANVADTQNHTWGSAQPILEFSKDKKAAETFVNNMNKTHTRKPKR